MTGRTATRVLAVVGDPIAHSLSPAMHNAAIAALGLDATYLALRTTRQAFPALVTSLLEEGGACSVTYPFKDDAYTLDGIRSDDARRTLSVNCIWGDARSPSLDNTDVAGIRHALRELMCGAVPARLRVFGSGASARAAVCAVLDEWPGCVVSVSSRSPQRAADFAEWAMGRGAEVETGSGSPRGDDCWLNATPVVAAPPADIVGARSEGRLPAAYLDLNYRAGGIRSVAALAAAGVRAHDGRNVLVGQGAAAFERFFARPAPLEIMRRAVEDALAA